MEGADLRGSPGNFRGSLGDFRGSLGNFRGTSGLLLSSTVRELPGKWQKNFWGSSGKFRASPGTSPEARGSLTPSQRLDKFVPKIHPHDLGSQFPLENTKSPHPENTGKLLKTYDLAHPGPVLKNAKNDSQ